MRRTCKIALAYLGHRYRPAFRSREQLETWQDAKVVRHLAWVQAHAPFYRERFAGSSLTDWKNLPTVGKTEMMDHFDRLNTAGLRRDEALALALKSEACRDFEPKLGGVTVGLSSGTSGYRGLFLVSDAERYYWAGTALAKVLPTSFLESQRIALFLRANSNLYTSAQSGRVALGYFDLCSDLDSHIERLADMQPTALIAPPSVLRHLGKALEQGRLTIRPRRVVAVAEVLDPLDGRILSRQFGQRIHQIYQATEGFLGHTCSFGTLHLSEDVIAVQKEYLVEGSRTFVPVLTDFVRRTQPIIRYRLDDLLTERAEPCPCGSAFTSLDGLEGRERDIFYLPGQGGRRYVPIFPGVLREAVVVPLNGLEHYQVRQLSADRLQVALEPLTSHLTLATSQPLTALWRKFQVVPPKLEFVPYSFAPGATKLNRIEQVYPDFIATKNFSKKPLPLLAS